jgi:hypothetical protein
MREGMMKADLGTIREHSELLTLHRNKRITSSSELKVRRSIARGFNSRFATGQSLRAEGAPVAAQFPYRTLSFSFSFTPGLQSRAVTQQTYNSLSDSCTFANTFNFFLPS